jgi:protein-S-isoprenylcysteine O-methyltransferase Ste14
MKGAKTMNQKNDHAAVVVNPFVIYLGLGIIAVLLQRLLPLPFLPASAARMMGLTIMILSLGIGLPAVRGMLRAKTSPNPHKPTTSLIRSGPYRFSRNPMYIGLTLEYTGLVVFFQLTWGLLLLPVIVWLITVCVITPEEEYLEHKFGQQYITYKSSVRRWI